MGWGLCSDVGGREAAEVVVVVVMEVEAEGKICGDG